MRNHLSKALATLLLATFITPLSAQAESWDGGRISGEKILRASDGVFEISKTIEIPNGSKLTVRPGTTIVNSGADPLFFVHGTLSIEGSATDPVNIESSRDIVYLENAPETSQVIIKHAVVDGKNSASLVPATGNSQTSNFIFEDSDFLNLGTYSYIWYPRSFRVERNTFKNSAGFSIGFDVRDGENTQPVFRNNLFDGAPRETYREEYWIQHWASYGGELLVENNTFAGGPYTAIRNQYGDDKSVRADRNYWGTTNQTTIQDMVYDYNDSLSIGGVISTGSPLSSPDPLTPKSVGDRTSSTDPSEEQAPPAEEVSGPSTLTAGGTTITWNADNFYEPNGCTQYSFEYSQSNVLFATMEIRNRFNDTIALGAPSGSSGTESLQICDFQFESSEGPFKVVLSSTADFSSGGDTTETEAAISFRSRSGDSSTPVAPAPEQSGETNSLTAGGTTITWNADNFYEPNGCTQYSFEYSQSNVLFATMEIRNRFNDTIALGAPSGSSGTESLQICDFQFESSEGPFKVVLSSTADFSSGGDTTETEAAISFRSRSGDDSGSGSVNVDHLAGQGPRDGEFKAWTKMMSNGRELKFYAKYLQPGQKVQFMVQDGTGSYVQYAWKRIEANDLNSDGSYSDMQNHIYFIRTLDLKPGKNRVRVLVDGQIVWGTKTYVR